MSAITTPAPNPSPGSAPAGSAAAVEASCRVPLCVLFVGAAVWLVAASLLGLVASLKFHAPELLANIDWLTYGRVHAAARSALLYGFAIPTGLGVGLWIIARLGGRPVSQPWLIGVGGKIWHLGVAVGLVGILAGDSTGFQDLEMPRYAALILFLGYLMIGLWTVLTLHYRRERRLSPAQWFLLTALFWFPWIYSTANLLLLVFPVRGVNQAVIAWWYSDHLTLVWLSLVGLAAAFYFVPKLTGRPLHSDYLALFTFWTIILFGGWVVVPAGAPVPAWMPTMSTIASVLIAVPLLAVAVNLHRTLHPASTGSTEGAGTAGAGFATGRVPALAFIRFGVLMWLLAGAMKIAGALPEVSPITQFTWFTAAQSQLNAYGFFAMVMFGSIYAIVPQVAGLEWPAAGLARWHFRCSAAGILLNAIPLAIGGVMQGLHLNQAQMPFMELTRATLPYLRASTTGDLLMLAGNLLLALNLAGLLVRFGRVHFVPVYQAATAVVKPAEARP
jgi:cytochrome c oxidase cbb3-type subunit 1